MTGLRGLAGALAACVVTLLAASAGATPVDEANAGETALNKGDNAEAIRLFTQALDSGALSPDDQERAHVQRAQAYAATGDGAKAGADLDAAAQIAPSDPEITKLRASLRDAQPSLEDTIQYLRTHILESSPIQYDLKTGPDDQSPSNLVMTLDNFETRSECIVSWDIHTAVGDMKPLSSTVTIDFASIDNIKVEDAHEIPGWANMIFTPRVLVVSFHVAAGEAALFQIDELNAHRLAKAMTHAAELCHHGHRDPFD